MNIKDTPLPDDTEERIALVAPIQLASLALASKIEAAKLRTLKLDHARQVARYGASSPQVADLEAEFDARVVTSQQRDTDVQKARVAPVPTDPDHLIVHGRVVDANGSGVAGIAVSAQDASGKALATAKSDSGGYYDLDVAAKAADKTTLRTGTGAKALEHHTLDVAGGKIAVVDLLVKD